MPLLSSGIIVVEKPSSSASITRINTSTSAINANNSSIHPPQDQTEQHTQIQYIEYYDVHENQLSQRQQQQQQHQQKQQQQQQHQQQQSTIVVDATLFHQQQQHQQQQQFQLGGSSGVAIGRKVHSSSSSSVPSSTTLTLSSSPALCATSTTLLNKQNLQIQPLKAVPMPQTKYSQQQQIIQHTSHSTTPTSTISNPQHHLHQQSQHVQQISVAASSIHHQTHQHHTQQQQQPTTTAHMIQVSEEFLEQAAANNHNTGSMMISTTGEVINQQQIFKIVSTDGTTGNMIIDATNQNANPTATTSKVLLSNLTVLSKPPSNAQGQIITNNHQQPPNVGQTINFVNAKNLYTASTACGTLASGSKQQKFAVATTNVANYKSSSVKQNASVNSQYLQTTNPMGQQKINMTASSRNVQMLTTRLQNSSSNNTTSNITSNNNSIAVISNNAAPAPTMVLQQQPQKFITNTAAGTKVSTTALGSSGNNVIKKSTTTGTLRMNNSHNTTATKLMSNLQTTAAVKTFIAQSSNVQAQTQQNMNQLTLQHHATKTGSKSKFVKQYNNAILNSAGAVTIATLPHQQSNGQNNLQIQQQQPQHHHQQLQPQTTYINHHKTSGSSNSSSSSAGAGIGSTKINKINSKYAQSVNMEAQLPPGTQLHQKSIIQSQQQQQQQQQFQTTNSNSNIKFVNAQGTVIQQQHQQPHQQHQQPLSNQKLNSKHHHHHHQTQLQQQPQYQTVQSFDTVDGNTVFHQTNSNSSAAAGVAPTSSSSSVSSVTTSLPLAATTTQSTTLLTDDIMMVNGTQMTDELSARILQSMSQKSFSNQRYHQQQQHVFQTKNATTAITKNFNNNNNTTSTMLPPPSTSTQNTIVQTNNNSNILLSPREYTLYPTAASSSTSSSTLGIVSTNQPVQQQQLSSPIHYNNSSNPTAATASSNITAGSFSSNNYIAVSNNNNNMTSIMPHTTRVGNLMANSGTGSTNTVRQAQSAPGSRSQSMERKLHESSITRKSSDYYKVKIKDYQIGCAFVIPSTAAICATNTTSPCTTSLIDFLIPLPSCTTITTTNNITTSSNCATMTTIITNTSFNHNINQINNNSNHNSLRGSSHHNNIANASAQTSGSLSMTAGNISAPVSNLLGSVSSASTLTTSLAVARSPSIPPAALIIEPQAQVIHLQATKTLPGANNSSNDDDDDIIGEEVRPAPVETDDIRLRILHAVLLDHTYVNPMPLELPTSFAVQLQTVTKSTSAISTPTTTTATGHNQQWSLGGIGAITAAGSGSVAQQSYALYGSQLSRLHKDIDSYSILNNNPGLTVGDIDPGEETETAAEAELEDDSITRCICDLTHDDGYMICCDKCCAWQHVDCMGIDRQNIPDEYLCELCQPRVVDKARARSLQLMKRKEQQQQLMLTTQAQASGSAGTMGAAGSANGASMGGAANVLGNDVSKPQQRLNASSAAGFNFTGNMSAESAALKLLAAGGSNVKKTKLLKKSKDGVNGKRNKKAEKLAAAAAAGLITNSKPGRKETKKNTKRKKAGASHDGNVITVGMTAAEKHAANLRQWIENYELAVTNHYSPELRARLHAISKQPSILQSILNTENPILKEFSNGSLENRATTVPHAGAKILISNLDIVPNSPICELRGKYMLTTQYKTQNTSMNMNSPPPNNYHLASYKAHKTPGPFIFFYQLPGSEMASSSQLMPQTTTTTTLNPDGTYTTTTTTLPAQQSPPTFIKGHEICVDTRTYGNEARFVRRSCRPNAEIQHLFEKGTIHLFIVALTDIRASTEITIRHEPHDLLAIDNKKSSSMIIQPTSTPCACGLTKDCIFGPPIPQLPPKSNACRKSLANSGGVSGNSGNLTAKQRKANQQNMNRNRSISSSASGDSNMGVTQAANTISMSLNSPNNVCKMPPTSKITNSNTLMPLTAACNNSNLSNASSTSSTLASVMHDSGVCTSSSSPSVSIPSPTQHLHSPIQQQQQQVHQHQIAQQQLMHNTQIRSTTVQLLPQQQQQQIMQSLPTPLVLPSRNATYQQQLPPQHSQQQALLPQQPPIVVQQQPINVISSQSTATVNAVQEGNNETKQKNSSMALYVTDAQLQSPSVHPQKMLLEQQKQVQTLTLQQPAASSVLTVTSAGLLETVSSEATIAAVALQTLNASYSPNNSIESTSLPDGGGAIEKQLQSPQIRQQQQQVVIVPIADTITEQNIAEQTIRQSPSHQNSDNKTANSAAAIVSSAPQQSQTQTHHQTSQQQHKSPQKSNHSQNSGAVPTRKTPGKHARATSFSEETDQHSEDNSLATTPTSSTPKEKPKLSREDRKMEAILRAIEKMERNQQKQKQAKRQNSSSSHNTTPTSPNKTLESGENSGTAKRSNSHTGTAGRSKKKRKAGAKGGHGGGSNNQRKRRQSRMNSQESVDECNPQDNEAVTSESDNCTMVHSPAIQTNAHQQSQPQFSTSTTSSSTSGSITTFLASNETANNVDQAAGLLMAFANPNISPVKSSLAEEIAGQQSPQRSASHPYMMSTSIDMAAASPPTPPSQVSSACLLIEAAVGPLETNLDNNTAEIHSSEFKYPLQAKTKKHLMNNWLHQAEDIAPDSNVSSLAAEQNAQSMQTTTTSAIPASCSSSSSSGVGVSGGLDSLLQAAMSDLTQSQSDQEQPQNLSIAALKVEEFIQQTEASACNVQQQAHLQIKHSFDYEQQRTYANLPTPAVDLTLKTPLTIGPPNVFSSESSNNRNLHLPLQVSTCSNNSSVKKRWLRQAISEETHEEFQQTFSLTASPTTVSVGSAMPSAQPQQATTNFAPAAATATNYVPNGFTTPLKKRRLLLTGKDEFEENVSQACGDLCSNATPSPPDGATVMQPAQHQQLHQQNQMAVQEIDKEKGQVGLAQDMREEADVDVEKYEVYGTQRPNMEMDQDLKYCKVERNEEEDVDVTTSNSTPSAVAVILPTEIKTDFKYETDVAAAEMKQEYFPTTKIQPESIQPAEFNDQDDDVDILRSPSPGREMIKAEDNLVKIEPEDTSGLEDVKIDVEREEESNAADDVVVSSSKEHKEQLKSGEKLTNLSDNFGNMLEMNEEFKTDMATETLKKEIEVVLKRKSEDGEQVSIKEAEGEIPPRAEFEEPKVKRLKLGSESERDEESVYFIKNEILKKEENPTVEESTKKSDISINKEEAKEVKTETGNKKEKPNEVATEYLTVSTTLQAAKAAVANDSCYSLDLESSATPPPPPKSTVNAGAGTAAPIQRNKSLSDDDIQARLHSFHKENILFLQSRNKKTKSSSSVATTANANNCLANNNEHNKSRTSSLSSSSSYHQHHNNHHHHHHYHEGKEKSNKLSLKHHKSTSTTTQHSGGSNKKQKLHKRERTTSSSSSSNSHKNSTNSQVPPATTSSVSSKNSAAISTSISSKKLKSLKKSSSGSSTSSSASLTASTLTPHNSCTSGAVTNASATSSEKDKHNKQRTISTSGSNNNNVSTTAPHTLNYPSSKKRQLNFELELTKDLHMLNSGMSGGNKYKKDISRLLTDDQSHVSTKKSRKDVTSSMPKEQLRNGSNKNAKMEKHLEKKSTITTPASTSNAKLLLTNSFANSQPTTTPATNISIPTLPGAEEAKLMPTIVGQPVQPALTTAAVVLREHPTLPHFNNNVIVSNTSALISHQQQLPSAQPALTPPVLSQSTPAISPQSIPNHMNSPNFKAAVSNTTQVQHQQPSLPPTPPPLGPANSPLPSTPSATAPTTHLPFYNTIYGKLLDNSTPPPSVVAPTLTPLSANAPTPSAVSTTSVPCVSGGVLSEYLDTKMKSYNTLGGYVSHSALFGLGNTTAATKESLSKEAHAGVSSPRASVGPAAATAHIKDSSTEMPAPLAPSTGSVIISGGISSAAAVTMPLKIHTKTASHDPRLNPQLTAPEPPPQPKRKLSINEYRKRMQQSSSSTDSNCGSGSLTTNTPTTPPTASESSTLLGGSIPITNKCTLYSPDRLTQSVDSQIQKEIMSTTSAVSSSDSLNSSNSSTALNDTPLKSSSFVEEDSTKGQFNAAPTLLEKQQESLCARLKSLKEKQSLGSAFSVSSGNRSRFSSFSESVASSDFGLRKDEDEMDIIRHRNLSVSSSIGGDLLDNCLEEISSTSTSMSSSREPSPERCYTSHQHKILTTASATATTTNANTSTTTHSNSIQTARHHQQEHHQQHNINCDKNELTSLERKRSVDIA